MKMADNFVNLPPELIQIILLKLSPKDILATWRTNTHLNQLLDDEFWDLILDIHFPDVGVIPGFTYPQTISYILTPKIINIKIKRQSHLLAITGDMTIGELSAILNDKFSINFPSWYDADLVLKMDNMTVTTTSKALDYLSPHRMLASIPLLLFDSIAPEGDLFTAVIGINATR